MTSFTASASGAAAIALTLIGVTLLFILPSLLRSAGGLRKLSWLAVALTAGVPVAAIGLYFLLGTAAALDPQLRLAQAHTQGVSQEQILGMVQKLADRLEQQPGDAQGWNMLARSYFELQRYHDATDAYAHLTQLVPDNADYLSSYALTMALANNKNLLGEPETLLRRALTLDPKNIRALSLLGSAAFERHDYAAAIVSWQQVLTLTQPDSAIAKSTQDSMHEAQALLQDATQTFVSRSPTTRK